MDYKTQTPFPCSKTYPLSAVAVACTATHPRVSPVFKAAAHKLASMRVSGIGYVTYTRDALGASLLHTTGQRSIEADQVGLSDRAAVYIAHTDDGRKIYAGSTINVRQRIFSHLNEDSDTVNSRKVFSCDVIGLMVIQMPTVKLAKELESFINDILDYEYLINVHSVGTDSEEKKEYYRSYNNALSAFKLNGQPLSLNAAKQHIFHKRKSCINIEFDGFQFDRGAGTEVQKKWARLLQVVKSNLIAQA